MKQVYPQVRPRRLGTRGNSRYCYAGLKKRLKLDDPITPECGSGANNNGVIVNSKNNNVLANDFELELDEAASYLIRIWSEKLLTVKFTNLRDLAVYLVDKGFVDNRSAAAHTVISAMTKNEGTRKLESLMTQLQYVSSALKMQHVHFPGWKKMQLSGFFSSVSHFWT